MNTYLIIKSLHIIGMVCWFSALFYLPRLFIYHTRALNNKQMYDTFSLMERKLIKIIMTPSMIATVLFGLILVYIDGLSNLTGWFHVKIFLVILLFIYHYKSIKYHQSFVTDTNKHSELFYRIYNEVPAFILIGCVFLAICKPF